MSTYAVKFAAKLEQRLVLMVPVTRTHISAGNLSLGEITVIVFNFFCCCLLLQI